METRAGSGNMKEISFSVPEQALCLLHSLFNQTKMNKTWQIASKVRAGLNWIQTIFVWTNPNISKTNTGTHMCLSEVSWINKWDVNILSTLVYESELWLPLLFFWIHSLGSTLRISLFFFEVQPYFLHISLYGQQFQWLYISTSGKLEHETCHRKNTMFYFPLSL